MRAMTRIGPLRLGHSSGSASYTLRMSRAQAAFARAANALTGSASGVGSIDGSWCLSAFARSPRARLEYQPTYRSPLPDLPTISEAGVPGYESAGWFGVVASAGTPEEIVTRLNREINDILQSPDVKARLTELGAKPASLTPPQFLDFIRGDNDKWARLIKERGIVIERQ